MEIPGKPAMVIPALLTKYLRYGNKNYNKTHRWTKAIGQPVNSGFN
jgi:hypothetical protein